MSQMRVWACGLQNLRCTKTVKHIIDIIHLDTIVCSAHLIAVYGDNFILKEIPLCYILDLFHSNYVNKYIDHHAFEIAF